VRFSSNQENTQGIFSELLNLFNGEAYLRSRRPRELGIETPFVNAMHEGTEFLVKVNQDSTQVVVFDGVVVASNDLGKISISAGESALAEKGRAPVIGPRIELRDAVQWTLYYPPVIDYTSASQNPSYSTFKPVLDRFQSNDLVGAFEQLDQVSEVERNADYHILYTSLSLMVGQVEQAQQHLNQVSQQNGNVLALRSIIALAKNDQQQALKLAQQAQQISPQAAAPKMALSYAYQSLFDIDKALTSSKQAAQADPDNGLAWARVSEMELATGNVDASMEAASKAQALNPQLVKTNTVLGFARLASLDLSDAEQSFRTAIKRDPSDPLARLGLGLAKIRQGHIKSGTKEMETAANLDPDNALIRSYLGKAYYEQRRGDIASTEYAIAKKLDPNDPTPWFYDAIYKQTVNRPVEALHDMQKAIELNDNRAVYRSRLLLDDDLASKGTSLARIFDDIQFDQVALLNATKSLDVDPDNYSAHRFLSDSYVSKPRHEIARASEILQSQLLQPVNTNPVQPRLSITDLNIIEGVGPAETSFMEYTPAFESDGARIVASGLYGSNNTLADEAVISGLYNKFSYSLGQFHYETDGFRQNNDLQHDLYNVFGQVEILPGLNIQGEFRHRNTKHGDLDLKGDPDDFEENNRRKLKQNTYRFGAHASFAQNSDLILSLIYANRDEVTSNHFEFKEFDQEFDTKNSSNTKGYQVELQHIYNSRYFNTILGGGAYLFDVVSKNNTDFASGFCPPVPPFFGVCSSKDKLSSEQYFGYLYSQINFPHDVQWTLGLSYDSFRDTQSVDALKVQEWNPKFGVRWNVTKNLIFRAAAFQTVKSPIVVNQLLQPTQIAGFNQFFDDLNGSRSREYGIGIDAQILDNLYTGIETIQRFLKVPTLDVIDGKFAFTSSRSREQLYRAYMNWTPVDNWAITAEYRFEKFNQKFTPLGPRRLNTSFIPFSIRYFSPWGFFSEVGTTYIQQTIRNRDGKNDSTKDFMLVDAAIGYRFPKRLGMISLEAKNIFDKNFKYRDRNFLMNEERSPEIFPEQTLFARITFNF
jgi:tetratricopeptide (TPR) repeat protein